jgi:hypothetical protein
VPEAIQSVETTGSQWIPVEEQTFEFDTEPFSEAPDSAFSEPSLSMREAALDDKTAHRAEPLLAPLHVTPDTKPFIAPLPDAEAGASATTLSEEQLKAAITGASREVIERIVWEIVPDLAEAMIREAILKIQEGR